MVRRREDLYGYAGRLERALERIAAMDDLPRGARKDILAFTDSCTASGLSAARTLRYLNDVPKLARRRQCYRS